MTRKGIDSETVQINCSKYRDVQGDLRIGISLDKNLKIEELFKVQQFRSRNNRLSDQRSKG